MVEELELFIDLLKSYFRSRGKLILSLMDSSRQKSVKIEFHGLYHYFKGSSRFHKFTDLYDYIKEKYGREISIHGYRVLLGNNYIVVPRELIGYFLERM